MGEFFGNWLGKSLADIDNPARYYNFLHNKEKNQYLELLFMIKEAPDAEQLQKIKDNYHRIQFHHIGSSADDFFKRFDTEMLGNMNY